MEKVKEKVERVEESEEVEVEEAGVEVEDPQGELQVKEELDLFSLDVAWVDLVVRVEEAVSLGPVVDHRRKTRKDKD